MIQTGGITLGGLCHLNDPRLCSSTPMDCSALAATISCMATMGTAVVLLISSIK